MEKLRNLSRMMKPALRDIVLNRGAAGYGVPHPVRAKILRAFGHRIAGTAWLNPRSFYGNTTGLTVGEGSFVNYGCFFDLGAPTTIGARCAVGYEVMFVTCTHEPGDAARRAGSDFTAPIVVGDGVWIGARAVIMPGVTIHDGCVIAAGSVVTQDCEPHSLYAGVPAKLVRSLPLNPKVQHE